MMGILLVIFFIFFYSDSKCFDMRKKKLYSKKRTKSDTGRLA